MNKAKSTAKGIKRKYMPPIQRNAHDIESANDSEHLYRGTRNLAIPYPSPSP
jgi:hypothetical protein